MISVEPLARGVIGPGVKKSEEEQFRGRVDLIGSSDAYHLYLTVNRQGEEHWLMVDDRDFQTKPFSRENFEAALLRLFE